MPNQWQDEVIPWPLGFLSAAWRTSPGKATSSPPRSRAEHAGSNKSAGARAPPASASCSRGAVTSQIPASLFIPFCSGSETPAVFTPALAGPAPRTRAARLQAAAAAALDGGGGACSPRAVPAPSGASQAPARSLPTAAFGRRMLPGSECYTYTFHSRHDSADLIHPRSPRCHWPGVTSGGGGASAAPIHNPRPAARCRLGAGSAGGAGAVACAGSSGASSAAGGRPRASPSDRPGLVPGLGCVSSLREPAPPRGGGQGTRDRLAFPGPRCPGRPGRPRLPAGSASPSLQRGVCGFLERMLENGALGRARGVGEERKIS